MSATNDGGLVRKGSKTRKKHLGTGKGAVHARPDNIQCGSIEDLFAPYLAAELSKGEEDKLRKHVRSCANCKKILAEETRFNRIMRQALAPKVDPDYWELLWPRVQAKMLERREQRTRPRFSLRWIFAGAGTAFASAAALIAVLLLRTPLAPSLALHPDSYFEGLPQEPPATVQVDSRTQASNELAVLSLGHPTPSSRSHAWQHLDGGGL